MDEQARRRCERVDLERDGGELLERAVIGRLLPGPAKPRLDRPRVALREMLSDIPLLSDDAALNGHVVAEHLLDLLAQRLPARGQPRSQSSAPRQPRCP